MTKANERFLVLEKKLVELQNSKNTLSNQYSRLCEEMGDLWWAMSDEECANIRAREWNAGFDNKQLEENAKRILDSITKG